MSDRTPLPSEPGELLEELRRTTIAARTHERNFNVVAERALSAERRVEELERENAQLRLTQVPVTVMPPAIPESEIISVLRRELELSLRESERLRLLIRDHIYGGG